MSTPLNLSSSRYRRPRNRCPHCGETATIRTSKIISEITRELYMQCTNIECAHTWVNILSAVRTIAPSMCPNPKVYIPMSPHSPALKADPSAQGALDLGEFNPRAMAAAK